MRKTFPRNGRSRPLAWAWNCSALLDVRICNRRSARPLTLGLSGIVDGAADARKIAGVFVLQDRMMAVRLIGRKLVAFHPDRDMKLNPERFGFLADRMRVSVWSANGKLVGKTERYARPVGQILEQDSDNPVLDCSMRSKFENRTLLASAGL